jgi:hypothetical protein
VAPSQLWLACSAHSLWRWYYLSFGREFNVEACTTTLIAALLLTCPGLSCADVADALKSSSQCRDVRPVVPCYHSASGHPSRGTSTPGAQDLPPAQHELRKERRGRGGAGLQVGPHVRLSGWSELSFIVFWIRQADHLEQHDYSTRRQYLLENAVHYSPRSPSFSSRARSSLRTRPPPFSSAFRSCSRTRTHPCDRWCT